MGLIIISFIAFVSLGLPDGLLGVAWPGIRDYFDLPVDALGIILICGTGGYMLSSFLSGVLMRRLGIGRLLSLSCAATAGSLFVFASTSNWWIFVMFAALSGLGAGHPFVLLANKDLYEKSGIDWWTNWFMQFPELFEFFPAWFIVSIALTLLEVVLYMRSRQDTEEPAFVSPAESLILTEEQTALNSAPVKSRIVMIESIQQYKTIYRLTPEGISEEIARKTFEELTVDAGNTLLLVHKSFMVAPDLIERIQRDGRDYSLVLKHIKKPIPISRNKLEDVRALLL